VSGTRYRSPVSLAYLLSNQPFGSGSERRHTSPFRGRSCLLRVSPFGLGRRISTAHRRISPLLPGPGRLAVAGGRNREFGDRTRVGLVVLPILHSSGTQPALMR